MTIVGLDSKEETVMSAENLIFLSSKEIQRIKKKREIRKQLHKAYLLLHLPVHFSQERTSYVKLLRPVERAAASDSVFGVERAQLNTIHGSLACMRFQALDKRRPFAV